MIEDIVQKLTSKDDKYSCALADKIVAESHDTDAVSYTHLDVYKRQGERSLELRSD